MLPPVCGPVCVCVRACIRACVCVFSITSRFEVIPLCDVISGKSQHEMFLVCGRVPVDMNCASIMAAIFGHIFQVCLL
jgi:hypothetical protein